MFANSFQPGYPPYHPQMAQVNQPPENVGKIPPHILVAMRYIGMCQNHVQQNGSYGDWDDPYLDSGPEPLDLHPAQEGAMRVACQALADYLSGNHVEGAHGR